MKRTVELYIADRRRLHQRTDYLFGWLFLAQWIFAIMCALIYTPSAWSGTQSSIHFHVYLAIFGGAGLVSLPLYLIYFHAGAGTHPALRWRHANAFRSFAHSPHRRPGRNPLSYFRITGFFNVLSGLDRTDNCVSGRGARPSLGRILHSPIRLWS